MLCQFGISKDISEKNNTIMDVFLAVFC